MKKIFILTVAALLMYSCGDDVEFNTPALQGDKDGSLWKAEYFSGSINDSGKLILSGGLGQEQVILELNDTNVGTYTLGENSSNVARFINAAQVEYATSNEPDETVQLYPADGEIVVEAYNVSSNTITGTFWFNAFTETGLGKVNFSQGNFYRIPLTGTGSTVVSCDDAVAASQAAQTTYEATATSSTDYIANCNSYKQTLMQQIISCGDDNNILQNIIDGLNCDDVDEDGILNENEDVDADGDITNDDTDSDGIPNYLDNDDDGDSIPTSLEDVDGDGNVTNDDTDSDGIPNYLDNDDDGDGILTIDEDADGDGDPTNDDSDMDGIPDYLDAT